MSDDYLWHVTIPNSDSPNTYRKEPKIPLLGRAATAFTSIWWLEWCVFHKANLLIKKVLTENSLQLRSCLSRFSRIKLKVDLLRKYFRTLQTGQLPPAYSLSSSSLHFNNSESWSFLTFSSHPWGGRTLVGWLVSRQNGSWASTDRDTWYKWYIDTGYMIHDTETASLCWSSVCVMTSTTKTRSLLLNHYWS